MAKKKSPWANNGGSRPGAGAPIKADSKKVTLSVRVPQKVKDFLATVNASEYVYEQVVASSEFKAWDKKQKKNNSTG